MRFFSTVSVVLTAALAAISVAAPVAEAETKVVARQSTTSIASLWTTAFNQVNPLAESLISLDSSNATETTVQPILQQIQTPLNTLLSGVTDLQSSGAPTSQLLMSADGSSQLSVSDLASLMAGDMTTLFNGLGAAYGFGLGGALGALLYAVGILLYHVLVIVLALVAGLLAALTPLLFGIAGILGELGLGLLTGLLGL
ncbi:hypothetical protein CONPUDRAFT_159114 [Coniophora puteana RWD-64-598 SS2]|uniref:Uncharacterized protein n=1 Tax=Coniophora puteana (strain RWD-64-598) TaxID=741705 RepID=A0A5M3M9Q9_CONPW|nr:uncharacterized protein CONPUDRAFT_159114 [Coniophora puteana RWD-64-598 SS2]EIW75676.1 hypothetical protein CONPUDRAFT_159114 [Coniophora puteana RWD-64-598 SS2]